MSEEIIDSGWLHDPEASEAVFGSQPFFADTEAGAVTESLPTKVFGQDIAKKILGSYLPIRNQLTFGFCVGFSSTRALEYTNLAEIAHGESEEFREIAPEIVYSISRVQEAKNRWAGSDGSNGGYAAAALKDYGTIARGLYGKYDLTKFTKELGNTVRLWAKGDGLPTELLNLAKDHKITNFAKINSWDEMKKAIAQGYFIVVCSNQGFTKNRNNGVAAPSGSWAHAMCVSGYFDDHAVIDNSWDQYFTGSRGPLVDDGSFLAHKDTVSKMIGYGDTFALSGFNGFKKRKLNWGF
jgi:hypothetical protein